MSVDQNDMFRIDVIGDFDSSNDVVNVYQMLKSDVGVISDSDFMDDMLSLFTALYTVVKGLNSLLVTWRRIRVSRVPTGALMGERSFSPALVGTSTEDALPNQATFPVNFQTTTPRVVLRKFFGPGSEAQLTAVGLIAAAPLASMTSIIALLLADFTETNGVYQYGYNSPKALQWVRPVTGSHGNIFGAVRSRRIGVGG